MLVFILAITQSAIRLGREGTAVEDSMTLAELRAAIAVMKEMDVAMKADVTAPPPRSAPPLKTAAE